MPAQFSSTIRVGVLTIFLALLLGSSISPQVYAFENASNKADTLLKDKDFVKNKIIVKFKNNPSLNNPLEVLPESQQKQLKEIKGKQKKLVPNSFVLAKKSGAFSNNEMRNLLADYLVDSNVEYAEPVYIVKPQAWTSTSTGSTPSDYDSTHQKYLDIGKAPAFWQQAHCDTNAAPCNQASSIKIAVIDTGFAYGNGYTFNGATFGNASEIAPTDLYINSADDYGDTNGDGKAGIAGVDDDSDGKIDEDINNKVSGDPGYDALTTEMDDDEDGYPDNKNGVDIAQYADCQSSTCHGVNESKIGRAYDDMGHGTFVSNIISAAYDGSGPGVGIIPGAKIMPIKIFHYSSFFNAYVAETTNLVEGINAAEVMGAKIINMSLGTSADSSFVHDAIKLAYDNGIVMVAAAGNGGGSSSQSVRAVIYPAAYSEVISVGASTLTAPYVAANYSSYGSVTSANDFLVDLVAPVGNLSTGTDGVYAETLDCSGNPARDSSDPCGAKSYATSNFNSFAYGYGIGTSFAAPQITAAAAYAEIINPTATPAQIKNILIQSTTDIGTPGVDAQTGYGLFQFDLLIKNTGALKTYDTSKADFNGDGRTDILRQEKNGWDNDSNFTAQVMLSNTDGTFNFVDFSQANSLKGTYTNVYIGDFNGDGKSDILRQEKNGWDNDNNFTAQILQSNGDGTFTTIDFTKADSMKGTYTNLYIGDFNGDGCSDILRQEKNGWDNDSVFTAQIFQSNCDGTFTIQDFTQADTLKGTYTNLYIGDFNGDLKSDILRQEKNGWDNDSINTAQTLLSNGNGTFTLVNFSGADSLKGTYTNLYTGDFNGDEKTDILRQEKDGWDTDSLYTAQVLISNGNGTFTTVSFDNSDNLKGTYTNLYIGDFNGDGKTDLIRQEKNGADNDSVATLQILLSNGDGTFRFANIIKADSMKGTYTNLFTGDFDGDGRVDILRQEKNSWDSDSTYTAQNILSGGGGNYSIIDFPKADSLKGTYVNLY